MPDETSNPQQSPEPSSASDHAVPSRRRILIALLALTVSFCTISALGGLLVYSVWKGAGSRMVVGRYAVFVVFMAEVHLVGYRLWRRQFAQVRGECQGPPSGVIASAYRPAIKTALLQQGIVFILAALMLDGGLTLNAAVIAVVAYWLAFGIVLFRRASSPTRLDMLLVRYGFLLVFAFVVMIGPFVWAALGRL